MGTNKEHQYAVQVTWTGNLGTGTNSYRGYSRNHEICAAGKAPIFGSSDPAFRGDPACYNPEELLVSSLSTCHMLWYLHLCAESNVIVLDYRDEASGRMAESSDGGGRFVQVTLKPRVVINAAGNVELARQLHERAHHLCFIANSVNFPVSCEPQVHRANESSGIIQKHTGKPVA